jgi:hypothetical protein
MKIKIISLWALMWLLCACMAAQEIYATLTGSVSDPSGAVVPGASILVHNNETNTDVRAVTTDTSGNFTVTNLLAGNYTVTVKSSGLRHTPPVT